MFLIKIKFINVILIALIMTGITCHETKAQLRAAIKQDHDYIISKYPYTKTKRFERIYCKKYPETFDCREIGGSGRGMYPEGFTLADGFFRKLFLRPIGQKNYDALNIAGLYLRNKRPAAGDTTFEYTFLDIELDSLTSRVYSHHSTLTADDKEEVEFKLAYLSLLEENLFMSDDFTYTNELRASNNFEGPYYDIARRSVVQVLYRLKDMETNRTVLQEIDRLLYLVPAEFK